MFMQDKEGGYRVYKRRSDDVCGGQGPGPKCENVCVGGEGSGFRQVYECKFVHDASVHAGLCGYECSCAVAGQEEGGGGGTQQPALHGAMWL